VKRSLEKLKPALKRETLETPKARPVQEKPKVETKPKVIELAGKYTLGEHAIYTFGEIEFVKVPAGNFLMGTNNKAENASGDEKPQHLVDLPYEYFMGRFPVSNRQYAGYMEAVGTRHPVSGWEKKQDHPVVDVSWNDAMAYCKWLNDLLKGKLPVGLILRLPTEAEWEKAARGEKGLIYPWGDLFEKTKCNTNEGSMGDTTPAGAYSPQGDSPYGCAEMSGNVGEWTRSTYRPYPYQANDGREDIQAESNRVLRGGSFSHDAWNARCAYRFTLSIFNRSNLRGFRVVVSPNIS
jgi:formylglycine-generating enzyme required for sulfatase activity